MRDLTQQPILWKRVTIAAKNLTQSNINTFIAKGIKHLDIPYCSITRGEASATYSEAHTLEQLRINPNIQYETELSYLGLQGFRGEDTLAATLVATSPDLRTLDLSESRYSLMTTIIHEMSLDNKISAINLSSIRPHRTPETGEFHSNTLRLDTVRMLVSRCRKLTSLSLACTGITRPALAHICSNINPNLQEINMAGEVMTNNDLRQLSSRCKGIKYLNISDTQIKWGAIMDCLPTWKSTMVDLNLPCYIEYILHVSHRNLQDQLMMTGFINMIKSMTNLESMSINQYRAYSPDHQTRLNHTRLLQDIFPKLVINYDPFTDKGPALSDPSSKFKARSTPYRQPRNAPEFCMDDVNTST